MITEKGYISQFTYSDDESGYYVFELVTDSDELICVGNARGYGIGETVEVDGEYVNHPVYGRQIKISAIRGITPDTPAEIERYLGSGAIKGIGKTMAKRIVKEFGKDTFKIAQESPEQLSKIKGISLKKAYEIGSQIAEKQDVRDAMIFLQQYGISQNLANKIYNKYGLNLYEIMKENPYKIAEDIKGVGFKLADEIAMKSGISMDGDYRVRCGIIHTLTELTYEGNIYYPEDLLIQKAQELLNVDREVIEIQLTNLAVERRIVRKENPDGIAIYLSSYFYEEIRIARKLIELRDSYLDEENVSIEYLKDNIKKMAAEKMITVDDYQTDAVARCMKAGVFVLSGGPGTGKTTTINTLINYLESEGYEFFLAAPTGRAAKRISETTGYEAKTIHRLLEIAGPSDDRDSRGFFNRNEDNPLETDAVIIDEMSMVDVHLMRSLLEAVSPGTKLVLVGDIDQLSSVGPGEVLKDIMESQAFETAKLEKIYRQDEESHIISNAYKINHGQEIDFSQKFVDFFLLEKDNANTIYQYIEALMVSKIPKQFGIDILDTQILTPMKNGNTGVYALNKLLQERLNPAAEHKQQHIHGETIFRTGDKVMQIKNNYSLEWEIVGEYNVKVDSGTGVYNGDVGRITRIDNYLKNLYVLFEDGRQVVYSFDQLDELELAYAITIHKAQGSEYPVIIIPLLNGPRMLLTRNLFYTAVTRAQQCVILIGLSKTFTDMIHTDAIIKRYTSLKNRIMEENHAD